MKTTTIANVNEVSILVIQNPDKLVPIKPICEALGLAHQPQLEKIKTDDILSSTVTLSVTVGADKKEREMTCLPLKFVFGWLFTINPKNVNKDAREKVIKYKLECYNALYDHFAVKSEFLEEKQIHIDNLSAVLEKAQEDFNTKKERLAEVKKKFNEVKDLTFEQWQANKRQLSMNFEAGREQA